MAGLASAVWRTDSQTDRDTAHASAAIRLGNWSASQRVHSRPVSRRALPLQPLQCFRKANGVSHRRERPVLISGIQGSASQVIVYGIEPSNTPSADHHTRLALAGHVGASACAFALTTRRCLCQSCRSGALLDRCRIQGVRPWSSSQRFPRCERPRFVRQTAACNNSVHATPVRGYHAAHGRD